VFLGFLGVISRSVATAFNDRIAHTDVVYLQLEHETPWAAAVRSRTSTPRR